MNSLVLRKLCSPGGTLLQSNMSILSRLPASLSLSLQPFFLFASAKSSTRSAGRIRESARSFSRTSSKADGEASWQKTSDSPVYGTGSSPKSHKQQRVTTRTLGQKYRKGEKRLTVITAYDYPSAKQVDTAGADIVLVGDSAGMVVHGYDTTLPLTLDELLSHCRAVARGATRALLVGDLPFGCYEASVKKAVDASVRVMKEGAMDAVKIEGGNKGKLDAIKGVVQAGIAVMGHTGLTPQSVSVLGGFRSIGKSAKEAEVVYDQAMRLQDAGCFSLVLECIPSELAALITEKLEIPTIGIGSGPSTSGQVLVYHDMLGMLSHPHHECVTPKFAKRYANIGHLAHQALQQFCQEVESGSFPTEEYSPYRMAERERETLFNRIKERSSRS